MSDRSLPARRTLHALAAGGLAGGLLLVACGAEDGGLQALAEPRGFVVENPTGERPFYVDLGRLLEGELAVHVFEVRNTADVPVTILRVQADCGCTVPRLTVREPGGRLITGDLFGDGPVAVVPPDGLLEVAVQLDTTAVQVRNQHRLYRITALTDLPQNAFLQFEMTVFVDAPLQITPPVIDLGDVPVSAGGWGTATAITAVVAAPVRIEGVESGDLELSAGLDELRHGGQDVWEIRAELAPGIPLGPYRGEVLLDVVDEDPDAAGEPRRRRVPLPVRAQVVEDVVARPELVALARLEGEGGVMAGEARIVALVPGHRIIARTARVEGAGSDSIEVALAPIEPDSLGRAREWRVSLRFRPGPEAGTAEDSGGGTEGPRLAGTVRVELDEPDGPASVLLRYASRAR